MGKPFFISLVVFSFLLAPVYAYDHTSAPITERAVGIPIFDKKNDATSFNIVDVAGKTPTMKIFIKTVSFKEVELKRDPKDPTLVQVVLKGNSTVRVFPKAVSLADLEKGKRITVSVEGVKDNYAGKDFYGSATMDFQYDPQNGNLALHTVSGSVKVPLAFGQSANSSGILSDLRGIRNAN